MSLRYLFITLLFSVLPTIVGAQKRPIETPTLLQVLVDPVKYDGRKVLVFGYCRLEFEGTAIYLHKEDRTFSLGNTVWLEFDLKEITPENSGLRIALWKVYSVLTIAGT